MKKQAVQPAFSFSLCASIDLALVSDGECEDDALVALDDAARTVIADAAAVLDKYKRR